LNLPIYSVFNQSELDRQYSPSSCVENLDIYLNRYVEVSRDVEKSASESNTCLFNLAYGPSSDERLDLFLPSTKGLAPLQIYIHGGYWQALNKEASLFAAPLFQEHGAFFAALNYSLAPQVRLTEIVGQVRRAICWLHANAGRLGFDGEKIYLSGSSAGAHLAVMMLMTDWPEFGLPEQAVKGVCAVSGIYDLEPIRLSYVNEVLGMDEREALLNSPMRQRIRNQCPIVLAYGDNETSEFKRQTDDFGRYLLDSGCPVRFKEISDRNHFDVIMDLSDPDAWLSQQVLQQMGLICEKGR
jgi:arylformamidase